MWTINEGKRTGEKQTQDSTDGWLKGGNYHFNYSERACLQYLSVFKSFNIDDRMKQRIKVQLHEALKYIIWNIISHL